MHWIYVSWPLINGICLKRSFESNWLPIVFLTPTSNPMDTKLTDIFLVYYRQLFIWKNCRCNIYEVFHTRIQWGSKTISHFVAVIIAKLPSHFPSPCYVTFIIHKYWCAAKWRWHRFWIKKILWTMLILYSAGSCTIWKEKKTKQNTSICHTWTAELYIYRYYSYSAFFSLSFSLHSRKNSNKIELDHFQQSQFSLTLIIVKGGDCFYLPTNYVNNQNK